MVYLVNYEKVMAVYAEQCKQVEAQFVPDFVRKMHDEEGCCTHNNSVTSDGACCVCDAEAPCNRAIIDAAQSYDDLCECGTRQSEYYISEAKRCRAFFA